MVKIPRVVVADDHQSLLDRVVSILAFVIDSAVRVLASTMGRAPNYQSDA